MENIQIEEFTSGEEKAISNLIKKIFDEFVGHQFTKKGIEEFYDFIKPEKFIERQKNGDIILTAKLNYDLCGIIEVKDNNHISLLFVSKDLHKKGIAKSLFNKAMATIKEKSVLKTLTVNASIYSEIFYEKLGFIKTNELQEINGIKFIPMEFTELK